MLHKLPYCRFSMEDKHSLESMVCFHSSSEFPVKAQAISCKKELLNDISVYSFPGMITPTQVQGSNHLLEENFGNEPQLSRCFCYPCGFNQLAGYASDVLQNEASNWDTVFKIEEDPLLEQEKRCFSEHGAFFSLQRSAITSHINLNNQYMNPPRPLFEQFTTCAGERLTLFENGLDMENLICPHILYGFVTPTADECTFQIAGMCKRNAVVALAQTSLGDIKSSWVPTPTIQNLNNQLQEYTPANANEENGSQVSYGNQSGGEVAEVSSSFHEDTQELEDLMYSDEDEMSTDHSPSHLTWINMMENRSSGSCKRKKSDSYCCDEDLYSSREVESEFKENPGCFELVPSFINGGIFKYQSSVSLTSDTGLDLGNSSDPSRLHFCSAMQDHNNVKDCYDCRSVSGKLGQTTPRKRSRMNKIKMTIELLRSVIPGGNSMDTADVLGAAIRYIWVLQHKVSKLELIRNMDLTMVRSS